MESELLRDGTANDDSIHIGYRRIRVMTQYDYLAISGPTRAYGTVLLTCCASWLVVWPFAF